MKTSCGIIIVNEYDEIFMVHSTGNKFYDIPKGLLEQGEEAISCAIRECEEETSLIIQKDDLIDLGVFPYNKEKNLHLFLSYKPKNDINLKTLVCNSFFEDFYTKKMKPEADGFEWKKLSEIENYCAKSMGKLFIQIKQQNLLTPNKNVSLKIN